MYSTLTAYVSSKLLTLVPRPMLLLATGALLVTWHPTLRGQTLPTSSSKAGDSNSITIPHVATIVLAKETQSTIDRTFTGTVTPRRTSELGFKQVGRVETIKVDQGTLVKQGDVLATLDSATIRAEISVVEAQRLAANAVLDELLAGPRQQTLDAARAQVSQAAALRDQYKSTFERRSTLANSDAISRQDIDDSRQLLAAAEADVQVREHVLDELLAGTRKEKIAAQRAEMERLTATLNSLQVQLNESQIVAPFNGVVARRFVDEGSIVQPGESLLRILETDPWEVWVGLPAELTTNLSLNATYVFTTPGGSLTGVLTAILPELDLTTRTQTAVFELGSGVAENDENQKAKFAAGQIVQLNLSQAVESEGFWIPLQSLSRSVKGLWSVFVVVQEDSTGNMRTVVRKSDVEVLRVDDNRVLVAGAINSGDRIVASGVQKLTSGQLVYVATANPSTEKPQAE